VLKTVSELISGVPNSAVTWSDGSSRLIVTTSKENHARVRSYLDKENKALAQKVNVTFDIYSVKKKDNDEQGIDWVAFFNSLNTRYNVAFRSPSQLTGATSGTLAINTTSRDLTTTNNAVLALLAQYGESVQHRPVSFTTSQGVWDTTGRLSTTGYLKETTPGTASASGSAGAPGLKTDLITTGDQYSVLPVVLNDNTTLVRFSVTLSDLLGLFDVSTGSGETLQKVQTPQIEAITKGSMINLAPGETAVITGLSRRVAKRSENRLSKEMPILAGGSRNAEIATEHLLILVRATPL
jgi:type II secretory pathway component GspD/PulD (secretin)